MSDCQRQARSLHIGYGINQDYLRGAVVSMVSFLENNPDVFFTFHIFVTQGAAITPDSHELSSVSVQYENCQIKCHSLENASSIALPEVRGLSSSAFARIYMPAILAQETDLFLYCDADVVCNGSINELMAVNGSSAVACVVADLEKTQAKRRQIMASSTSSYFNSGVMLINIPNWQAHQVDQKIAAAFKTLEGRFYYRDQDVLNVALEGKVQWLDKKWDYLVSDRIGKQTTRLEGYKSAVLIHYAAHYKPWTRMSGHPAIRVYDHYEGLSCYANVPKIPPRSFRDMRQMANLSKENGSLRHRLGWKWRAWRQKKVEK